MQLNLHLEITHHQMHFNAAQRLHAALDDARSRYIEQNPQSRTLHDEAVKSLPGGNTRTVLHVDPFPLTMKSAKGFQVTSEDNRTYTDLVGEFSAALYGHSNPVIIAALTNVLQNVGINLGATTSQENMFARELCQRFNLERVRYTNSGTEGCLHALAAARLFTGKRRVVAFGGGYHGAVLDFTKGEPGANTVDIDDWIVAKYNDLTSATEAIQSENVAAVLVEGLQSAGGCINGTKEFLMGVQDAASKAGVVFILDEVMTSRLSGNGLPGLLDLKPDLRVLGKYIGGGLAFGAFGGRADIMAVFDPRMPGSVAHSGTFNNNTLVTHVGYAGLTKVYTPQRAAEFTETGNRFLSKLNEVSAGTKLCFTGFGSVMSSHFISNGPREIDDSLDVQEINGLKELFWFEMLDQGFWVTRRGFIALILETPQIELDRFVDAVGAFIAKYKHLLMPE